MPNPINVKLYKKVKKDANAKFLAPTSAYKSEWIVREYKKRGGLYKGSRSTGGLKRWFDEKWVNVSSPNRQCGRSHATTKGMYPVCRPSIRITKQTPRTVSEFTKTQLRSAVLRKQKIKQAGRINF